MVSLVLAIHLASAATSPPVRLSARLFTSDARARQAEWTGDAVAVRGTTTLTCERLTVYSGPGGEVLRLVARGQVHAVDRDREVWGEEADFDNVTGVLTVTGAPRGQQGPRTVFGEVVVVNTETDEIVVHRARTTSTGEAASQGKPVTITADRLLMRQAASSATWQGHVTVVREPTVLTAPELEAWWDAGGAITRVVARGGVKAVEPTRYATGRTADYDVSRGVLEVTGQPEAFQGKSHMKGTRVTFFPGTETVEVENATTVLSVDDARLEGKRR